MGAGCKEQIRGWIRTYLLWDFPGTEILQRICIFWFHFLWFRRCWNEETAGEKSRRNRMYLGRSFDSNQRAAFWNEGMWWISVHDPDGSDTEQTEIICCGRYSGRLSCDRWCFEDFCDQWCRAECYRAVSDINRRPAYCLQCQTGISSGWSVHR